MLLRQDLTTQPPPLRSHVGCCHDIALYLQLYHCLRYTSVIVLHNIMHRCTYIIKQYHITGFNAYLILRPLRKWLLFSLQNQTNKSHATLYQTQ